MEWIKSGQVFQVANESKYLKSHASNPLPIHLRDDIFRVFYSGRDENNRSSVGFVDIDIVERTVVSRYSEPSIIYGADDSFYSHGISIGNLYSVGIDSYILFMGWQVNEGNHWRGDIGRLRVIDNKKLVCDPPSCFLGSDNDDPISLSYPFVLKEVDHYKMWYGSTVTWSSDNGEMIHVIKYATSKDGINWDKHGLAIPYELGVAQAFSRPSVIRDTEGYHMWFSYRSGKGEKYRIGYAHSMDGRDWQLQLDKVGIDVSESGWDSEMICYPFVIDHKGERYMFYNGNSHGREGFGLAMLKK